MKPVVLIGRAESDWGMDVLVLDDFLARYGWVTEQISAGNVLEFDIARFPERGDAFPHLEKGSAVVGFHLYFGERAPFFLPGIDAIFGSPARFYNQRNNELPLRCRTLGIPLLLIGDYPDRPIALEVGKDGFWRRY